MTQRVAAFSYSRLFRFRTGPAVNSTFFDYTEDLAESAEGAPDHLSYIVRLKPDVEYRLHPQLHPRTVTAQDVVMSFQRYRDNTGRGLMQLDSVDTITPVDDLTVQFKLKRPHASFLQTLASPIGLWVLPMPEIIDGRIDSDQLNGVVGTGPFVLGGMDTDGIRLSRNNQYMLPGVPYLDGIDLVTEPEYVRAKVRFKDGSIDLLRPFAIDVPDLRLAAPDTRFYGDIPVGMNYLHFGGQGSSARIFRDERVRRAISMSIDRAAVLDTYASLTQLQNLGLPAEGRFHSAGVPAGLVRWWLDPQSNAMGDARRWYEFDQKEARALLSAAGVAPDFEFPYRYPRNGYGMAFNSIADSIASMLGEVGLRTRLRSEDYATTYLSQTQYGQYEGLAFGSAVPHMDVDDWLMTMLHSSSPHNQTRIKDGRLDALIEKQQRSVTLAERTSIIHEIQRYASDRMYFVPSATGSAWVAVGPRVRNYAAFQSNSGNYAQGSEHWAWLHLDS